MILVSGERYPELKEFTFHRKELTDNFLSDVSEYLSALLPKKDE